MLPSCSSASPGLEDRPQTGFLPWEGTGPGSISAVEHRVTLLTFSELRLGREIGQGSYGQVRGSTAGQALLPNPIRLLRVYVSCIPTRMNGL